MRSSVQRRDFLLTTSATGVAVLLTACSTPPAERQPTVTISPVPPLGPESAPTDTGPEIVSAARSPRDYRRDAATHLYGLNPARIYKGKLPPLLYAIGVLQVEVGRRGQVVKLDWMRAPRHAPEVVAEIERTVRQAAPFPAPVKMGRVIYTDTWLWHKSGRFQLDTLTEGQS